MRVRDFFEDYYNKNGIDIIRLRGVDWYYLLGTIGEIGSMSAIHSLTKEEVNGLIDGTLSASKIREDYRGWKTIDEFEEFFTEKHLEELKARVEAEEQKKNAEVKNKEER